jgi:predicted dehydrogenase
VSRPRLGFLGVGWIGRDRLEAVAGAGTAEVAAVADSDQARAEEVASDFGAKAVPADQLLAADLDGLVIATPSALHAQQAEAALSAGVAVFCQKPLARTAAECRSVVEAAKFADRLLGVDFSYRHVAGVEEMRKLVAGGAIGRVYSADLVFHNAYGPDKEWFLDPARSGGGCLIDLGVHLVDLAHWMLGGWTVEAMSSRLYRQGRLLGPDPGEVEDYAVARLELGGDRTVELGCSWFLHAGTDAVIGATFHGTEGSVSLRNVGGSFYDFECTLSRSTDRRVLAGPPDCWGGRAAVAWAAQLAESRRFDPAVEDVVEVASVIDGLYGR